MTGIDGDGLPGGRCIRRARARSTSCRCSDECIAVARGYEKRKRARVKTGRPGRVDAAAARAKLRKLLRSDESMTVADVARHVGLPRKTVALVLNSSSGRMVNVITAATIMAAPSVSSKAGARSVCGVGARRMVEALMTSGWPLATIASVSGVSPSTLSRGNLAHCAPSTVRSVTGAFERLRYTPGTSTSTARRARNAGYAPWHVWDSVIHDPDALPDVSTLSDPLWVLAIQQRVSAVAA